ncbi:uncharacterized protein LOC112164357 [Rosa chinensis]|uniref:uncharacterized protein LOC112164357 n=1 Tax=Rosa chinensis TaxID=74649 RepID=UPI000D088014|nr:uncharacterized protein LOC112164357 [Rosa chinensis]
MARRDPPYDTSVATLESIDVDWRIPLINYLKYPDQTTDRRIRYLALNYFLREFIIIATDFFPKWVEAEPLKEASGGTLRQFLFRNIICRFGIPEVFVSDWGAAFIGGEVDKLAYCTSKKNPTATIPYALMFGHDAVLLLEVNIQSLRVLEQHHLIGEDYIQAMWQEHEDLSEKRLEALDSLVMEKQRVARAYDKRTCGRSYSEGELVWKAVLPLGEKLHSRGKWIPRWEGPYIIYKILAKGAFHLKDLDGDIHYNPINDRYLKKYFPNVWDLDE